MTEKGTAFALKGRRVWVAGHRGMVGAALVRRLADLDCEPITVGRETVDLRRQAEVEDWVSEARPEAVFLAAATVGGILANDSRPAEFLYDNLVIEANVVEAARKHGVAKLMLLGSTCIYPRLTPQPMAEGALLTGPLEPTNQWYAIAKIAGIKLCDAYRRQYGCDFVSAQPTNLYGPFDNFDLTSSHVLPALLRKVHEARQSAADEVEIWGTGAPRREFLHVDDLADALVFLMERYSEEGHINVGTGQEVTIHELAELIAETVGFEGRFVYAPDKPDGMPRKLTDSSRLDALGWTAKTSLREGLRLTYQWFLDNVAGGPPDSRRTAAAGR